MPIDFKKRMKGKPPTSCTEIVLKDNSTQKEGINPSVNTSGERAVLIFSGYWSYYLDDLRRLINSRSNPEPKKFYLDVGRGFYLPWNRLTYWVDHFESSSF